MVTKIYAYEPAPQSYSASIFLVGPTPRNDEDKSWRPEALQALSQYANKLDLVVFIPESRDGVYNSNYLEQLEWEKQHLEMADAILAWIPRNMDTSMLGLTTNIEFGKYVESGKLFYGRPDNADKIRYLDWMYHKITQRQPLNNLTTLANTVITNLQAKFIESGQLARKAGERCVPLTIWSTPQFQSWYQSQLQAGNELLYAKLLWVFTIPKIDFTFSYILHVNVWIAAEDRIKSNEFIISRPDIAVVIPYWKHPTDILASEVVLIKEFRSPVRTKDSFVYELPGGSSFKKSEVLQVASDELHEETGIKIDSNRFRHLDSKQLAATWSTHYADVYVVELNELEITEAKQIAASKQTYGVKEDSEQTYIEVCKLKDVGKFVDWSMEGMIYRAILV